MDKTEQRIALVALAVIALACVIGGIVCAITDRTVPEFLVGTGGVAVGAIAGIATNAKGAPDA